MRRIANLALARSRLVVAGFVLVTLALGAGLLRLGLDNSIDTMVPDDSPVTTLQHQVASSFGAGKLLVAVVQGDIYTPEALTEIGRVTAALQRVDGVRRVTSVANARRMEDDGGFLRIENLVDAQHLTPTDIAGIRSFLATSDLYGHGRLVDAAGTAAAVVMEIDDDADPQTVLMAVRHVLDSDWSGPTHLAGSPLIEVEMGSTVRHDLPLLAGLAALLIVTMLFLNFRTVQGALLPLLTVAIGLAWSMGAMGWLGGKLTTLNIIGPVAILAVGSSFSLHLLGRFYFELGKGRDRREALRLAVSETGLGVLISGIAIAAAMATFVLSSMPTVRVLGLFTAGGVLATLLASLLLMPALLGRLPAPPRLPDPEAPAVLGAVLRRLARFVA
ncbi:MAG: MMPL family transporter, partial [Deinococcales bacterium]